MLFEQKVIHMFYFFFFLHFFLFFFFSTHVPSGNSIFIDEVTAKNEEGTSFSAGTSSGENWTNKVFAHKDATPVEDKREAGDACDEDEWD